jgi:hypothetical protein
MEADFAMRLEAAVPCVSYDDFLAITLPNNMDCLKSVTVLTAPWDSATIELARKCGVKILITTAWRAGVFNKAKALNEWLSRICYPSPELWTLVIDADILLPQGRAMPALELDTSILYSARRRLCEEEDQWLAFRNGERCLEDFPCEEIPIQSGRLWGRYSTTNPAGLLGYFQLWNPARAGCGLRFPEAPTASGYDVLFGLHFGAHRKFLPDYEVLHLGPRRTNWQGRHSERWRRTDDG